MLRRDEKTLIPFLVAGYPTLKASEQFFIAAIEEGARIIEVGVPFSDPVADGPSIQKASALALANGTNLALVLQMIQRLKAQYPGVAFVLFSYLNPLLRLGLGEYTKLAGFSGVSATLCVDLPPEESKDYVQAHTEAGLSCVFLASPTTDSRRFAQISELSTAFVYYISRHGVTGANEKLSHTLKAEVLSLKQKTLRPIAVGFGIATPAQAKEVLQVADAAIVGSHFVDLISTSNSADQAKSLIRDFFRAV